MNSGYTYSCCKHYVREKIIFKRSTTIQLYAQTNFHGRLKTTLNKKKRHFSSFSSGFRKILSRSDVELPKQAENDNVEQFRHYM